jgi:NDP-sugar pyrophosphorylase family protein
MTILGSMQHHTVPYGVMSIKDGGELNKITEKPEYDFLVNTGMYVFSPKIFNYIPEGKKFDITNLIEHLKKNNERIGVYPVTENSWFDVGQWDMYMSTKKIMNVK